MAQVNVTIKASAAVTGYLVHIDDIDVTSPSTNPTTLSSGIHHLRWWFAGKPGETLDIDVSLVGGASVESITDKIQPSYPAEAASDAFSI